MQTGIIIVAIIRYFDQCSAGRKVVKVSKKEVCLKFRRRTRKFRRLSAEGKIKANSGRQ